MSESLDITVSHAQYWHKHGDHPDVIAFVDHDPEGYCDHCENQWQTHGLLENSDRRWVVCPGDVIATDDNKGHFVLRPEQFKQLVRAIQSNEEQ